MGREAGAGWRQVAARGNASVRASAAADTSDRVTRGGLEHGAVGGGGHVPHMSVRPQDPETGAVDAGGHVPHMSVRPKDPKNEVLELD